MATQDLVTLFSVNDVAYFPIYATASIYKVQVTNVYLRTVNGQSVVMYDLLRLDKNLTLQGIPQNQLFTFPQAKEALINYLQQTLTSVTNLSAF